MIPCICLHRLPLSAKKKKKKIDAKKVKIVDYISHKGSLI